MGQRVTALLAIPLVVLAWFAGYRTAGRSTPTAPVATGGLLPVSLHPGKPVASFDGVAITDADVQKAIEEEAAFVRTRYASPEGRREYLDNLVRFELLAREAQKKGYAQDPKVIRHLKRELVSVYVQREFEDVQQQAPIAEAELKAYYDAHLSEYVRPERVRVAHVFWAAPAGDEAKRKAQRALAEAALAQVREKDAKDYAAFAELARTASEDPNSKAMGGDLQFLSREQLAARAGAEVAEAAFALEERGRVLDRLVEAPQGFHALKLLGREAALDLPFEQVRDSIRGQLVARRRVDAFKRFIDDLKARNRLELDEAALQALVLETPAPAGAAPSPGPAGR